MNEFSIDDILILREEFSDELALTTHLKNEEARILVMSIPKKHLNVAIDIYRKYGVYEFDMFVKSLINLS